VFLDHLERYGEYPVPFIVKWIDGKPDFRVVDPEKWDRCVGEKLCSICGYRLGEISFIVGGPETGARHLFFDPPMHKKCAEFSARVCPYVSGKDRKFSDRPIPAGHTNLDDIQSREASPVLFLFKVRTAKIRKAIVKGHMLLQAERMLGRTEIGGTATT
jgi:hypothetical protein